MEPICTYISICSIGAIFLSVTQLIYKIVILYLKDRRLFRNFEISSPEVIEHESIKLRFELKNHKLKTDEARSEIADLESLGREFKKNTPGIEFQVEKVDVSDMDYYESLEV